MRMRRAVFEAAVAQHSRRVFTLAVYLLGDREEAEDVAQDVLIRLWRKGHDVAPDRIESWLVQVTRNACVDAIRRRGSGIRAVTELHPDTLPEVASKIPGPESLARSSQLGRRILAALQKLSEPYRSVVILREVQGLSYQEIGKALEMPMSNVRVTLHRGRRRLREELRGVRNHVAAS